MLSRLRERLPLFLSIAMVFILLGCLGLHVCSLSLLEEVLAETSVYKDAAGQTQTSITLKGKSPLKGEYVCFWFFGILEGTEGASRPDAVHIGCKKGVWECCLDDPPPRFPITLQINRCPDTLRWWERILPVQRSQVLVLPAPDQPVHLKNTIPGAACWTVTADQTFAKEFGKILD